MRIHDYPPQLQMGWLFSLRHAVRQQLKGRGDDRIDVLAEAKKIGLEGDYAEVYDQLDELVKRKWNRVSPSGTESYKN